MCLSTNQSWVRSRALSWARPSIINGRRPVIGSYYHHAHSALSSGVCHFVATPPSRSIIHHVTMSGDEEQNVPSVVVSWDYAVSMIAYCWGTGRALRAVYYAHVKCTHSFVWSLCCPHGGAMDGWDRTKMTNDLDRAADYYFSMSQLSLTYHTDSQFWLVSRCLNVRKL